MNLLHWFFNKIDPEGKPNWLSIQFAHWWYSRRDKYNREWLKKPHCPVKTFDVAGAGILAVSQTATHGTGQTVGFGLYISWSHNGIMCGGVLGLEEANRLAIHIMEQYSKQTKSEAELVSEMYSRL